LVVLEDLQVKNMSRSAKGTQKAPGRRVRAKAGLNKAILDQGWAELRRQLQYKMQWCGGQVLAVDPKNTSRTCPECGHVAADNRKTQAEFRCVSCGHSAHADVVGALNILARGHRVLACGGDVSRARPARVGRATSVKQEPAEATRVGDQLALAP
jgi:putative transposase